MNKAEEKYEKLCKEIQSKIDFDSWQSSLCPLPIYDTYDDFVGAVLDMGGSLAEWFGYDHLYFHEWGEPGSLRWLIFKLRKRISREELQQLFLDLLLQAKQEGGRSRSIRQHHELCCRPEV